MHHDAIFVRTCTANACSKAGPYRGTFTTTATHCVWPASSVGTLDLLIPGTHSPSRQKPGGYAFTAQWPQSRPGLLREAEKRAATVTPNRFSPDPPLIPAHRRSNIFNCIRTPDFPREAGRGDRRVYGRGGGCL